VIEADSIAAAVRALMAPRSATEWTEPPLSSGVLGGMAGERTAKAKTWPDSPRASTTQFNTGGYCYFQGIVGAHSLPLQLVFAHRTADTLKQVV
jgi:hypothetical protein